MTTCKRCGKAVGSGEWDIHTCTPKPGLCDDCETVNHCLKHGCVPKHQALEQMAQNALVRADEREACAKVCESIESDGYLTIEHQQCAAAIRARGETK